MHDRSITIAGDNHGIVQTGENVTATMAVAQRRTQKPPYHFTRPTGSVRIPGIDAPAGGIRAIADYSFAIIEFGGDRSQLDSVLIVGDTIGAVLREVVHYVLHLDYEATDTADDFTTPVPDGDAPDEAFRAWLTEYQNATTVPWVSLFESGGDCKPIFVTKQ